MRKKIYIAIFIYMFTLASPAYAIVDIMATVQTILEKVTEVKTKVENIQKKVTDTIKKAAEGFEAASNCFANPMKCGLSILDGVAGNPINGVRTIPGTEALADEEIIEMASEELEKSVTESYSYVRGAEAGKDLKRDAVLSENLQGLMADEMAILFAKGMAVRQIIRNEDGEDIYKMDDVEENQSNIIAAQNRLILKSQERLSRILEIKAYIQGAQSTSEMSRYNFTQEEMEDMLN